jgi:hypothetical protein
VMVTLVPKPIGYVHVCVEYPPKSTNPVLRAECNALYKTEYASGINAWRFGLQALSVLAVSRRLDFLHPKERPHVEHS